MILAALYHDIGYVRGVCSGDQANAFVIDAQGTTIGLPRGASDAALAPYHIERSKLAVQERFGTHDLVDAQRVMRAIELTRFPVPADDEHRETGTEAGLMRAADLIGQLGDPLYPRKLNALFHEFAEVGLDAQLGYASPADLAERYPAFFWGKIEPVIGDAIAEVVLTQAKVVIAFENNRAHAMTYRRLCAHLGHSGGSRPCPKAAPDVMTLVCL
jgi:hypothetical protein